MCVWWMTTSTRRQNGGGEREERLRKTEKKAEKLREVDKKGLGGGMGVGGGNRWSELSLTAGEYTCLPQSDKWLSRSQTAGPKRRIHLQSNSDGKKLFLWSQRRMVTSGLCNTKIQGSLSLTKVHTHIKRQCKRQKQTKKQKQNKKWGLWSKAALSALVFIFSLLSVRRYELFMEQKFVRTTVQLLMKQSFRAARRGNHRHYVARE